MPSPIDIFPLNMLDKDEFSYPYIPHNQYYRIKRIEKMSPFHQKDPKVSGDQCGIYVSLNLSFY
ncbi:MAG: hypothetical protein Ct9H300mP24_0510 [Candidatus Neomarinimicrobiota bacterium]|nr:MAG: hypothetical protein Ct9H300mP24_0510 [Candidatus Neomarinimicrobiota bacterium]